jgi:hypothetical protein
MQLQMKFEYKDWHVELSGNRVIYWATKMPGGKHILYNTGGDQSLIKRFLDDVGLCIEREAGLAGQVIEAISVALASNDFAPEEKTLLGAEQARLEALLKKGS